MDGFIKEYFEVTSTIKLFMCSIEFFKIKIISTVRQAEPVIGDICMCMALMRLLLCLFFPRQSIQCCNVTKFDYIVYMIDHVN